MFRYTVEALSVLGHEEAGPVLLSLVKESKLPRGVREICMQGLVSLGYLPALEVLADLVVCDRGLAGGAERALVALVDSAPEEHCLRVLRRLKAIWEERAVKHTLSVDLRDQGPNELWDIAARVIQKKSRRFKQMLEGWPLGAPLVGDKPLPAWLTLITDH
jgi:hypothetical protein